MRIVTWNCKMGAHKKIDSLLALRPDVVVLQECASPDVAKVKPVYEAATSFAWTGDYAPQGLAVLTFNGATLSGLVKSPKESAIAARVTCGKHSFNLLGVWAKGSGLPAYVKNVQCALDEHDAFLRSTPSVVAGDFNSSTVFDPKTRGGHTKLVAHFESIGLVSAYHLQYSAEKPGKESRGTYFHHHNVKNPFHLDYIFRPRAWATTVEVPEPAAWLKLSDHLPVILTVN